MVIQSASHTKQESNRETMHPPSYLPTLCNPFFDVLKTHIKAYKFCCIKLPKNRNLKAQNGSLIGQPTASISTPIEFNNVFFVVNSIFITNNRTDLENLTLILAHHFQRLGKQMHVGHSNTKSKTEAMFFPNSLKVVKKLITRNTLPPIIALTNNQFIQFPHSFKYMGSTITTEVNKDAKIKICISKARSTLGLMKNFLSN
jgi:hypothetical protein